MQDLTEHLEAISEIKKRLMDRNGVIMNLTVSGAHLYGFESEDSDIDYRGTFIADTKRLLGLNKPRDVLEIKHGENDIVMFELQKEIGLALSGNCNVLEHINAKQILSTHYYVTLKQLVNNSFGKNGLYNSYKGMATFNYKKFILQGRNTNKKYLYVFRGLMAGIHVLQTGVIEPNITELNKYFKLDEVKVLIEAKRNGSENDSVGKELDKGALEERINYLFGKIDEAYLKSKIPERPEVDDVEKINTFLLQTRLDMLEEMR